MRDIYFHNKFSCTTVSAMVFSLFSFGREKSINIWRARKKHSSRKAQTGKFIDKVNTLIKIESISENKINKSLSKIYSVLMSFVQLLTFYI